MSSPTRDEEVADVLGEYPGTLQIRRLSSQATRDLIDTTGSTLDLLGGRQGAHYLVRPDGYIAYRALGPDLDGVRSYLKRWLVRRGPASP